MAASEAELSLALAEYFTSLNTSQMRALSDPEGHLAHRDGLWNMGFEPDDTL